MLEEEITFKSFDLDAASRVRPSAYLKRMQQLAREDLDKMGLTYEGMREKDLVFVVSKLRMKFFYHPVCHEKIDIKTYAKETRGVTFLRDFEAHGENGVVMLAASRWALLNFRARKIERPAALNFEIKNFPESSQNFDIKRIRCPEGTPFQTDVRTVYPSMLDENNHLNNCVYADIATDYLPTGQSEIAEIQLDFLKEATAWEKLAVSAYRADNGIFVEGRFAADMQMCFQAEIITG